MARSRKSGSGRGPKKLSRKLALVLREIGVISGDKFFKRFRPSMRSYWRRDITKLSVQYSVVHSIVSQHCRRFPRLRECFCSRNRLDEF